MTYDIVSCDYLQKMALLWTDAREQNNLKLEPYYHENYIHKTSVFNASRSGNFINYS